MKILNEQEIQKYCSPEFIEADNKRHMAILEAKPVEIMSPEPEMATAVEKFIFKIERDRYDLLETVTVYKVPLI